MRPYGPDQPAKSSRKFWTATTNWDLFLCHNRRDHEAVSALQAVLLEEHGVTTWMDRKSIPGGADFHDEILQALDNCSACAVILGPHGWGEYQKNIELPAILGRQKKNPAFRIILVLLPGADADALATADPDYKRRNWIDFRNGLKDTDAVWALVAAVRPGIENPELQLGVAVYHLNSIAARWVQRGGKDQSLLYQGTALAEAQDAARKHPDRLSEQARSFLVASEQAQAKAKFRRLLAVAVATTAFMISGIWWVWTRTDAYQIRAILKEVPAVAMSSDGAVQNALFEALGYGDRIADALALAAELPDDVDRVQALTAIIDGLAQRGKMDQVSALAAKIITMARAIRQPEDRARAEETIVLTLVRIGQVQEALSEARQMQPASSSQARVLNRIAEALRQAGQQTLADRVNGEAFAAAEEISDWTRADALTEVAHFWVGHWNDRASKAIAKAVAAADLIEQPMPRALALRGVAAVLRQAGKIEDAQWLEFKAMAVARSIKDDYFRATTLADIAKTPLEGGRPDLVPRIYNAAMEEAHKIEVYAIKAGLILSRAKALTKAGRLKEALDYAQKIQSVSGVRFDGMRHHIQNVSQTAALTRIAKELGEVGHPEAQNVAREAVRTAHEIVNPSLRVSALLQLLEVLKDTNDAGTVGIAALAAADEVSEDSRGENLLMVADALVRIGHEQAGKASLAALDATQRSPLRSQPWQIARAARILARVGRMPEALAAARASLASFERISDERDRSSALANVAETFADLYEFRLARLTAARCTRAEDRLASYTAILLKYWSQLHRPSKDKTTALGHITLN